MVFVLILHLKMGKLRYCIPRLCG